MAADGWGGAKMTVKWTDEQKDVIGLRDRNMLVSAAAGSGKTAVLVERILTMVTEGEKPIDVDELLVVTFTRAAAAEMKERILVALEERLKNDVENEHLQRQTAFVHNAQINTIDGFCAYVIKNYFHLIDLDPGYRVADEGELKLLKAEVVREVLEEYYAVGQPEFETFIEWYATGKNDANIEEVLLKLYDFSMSHPWPAKWLDECVMSYREDSQGGEWLEKMWQDINLNLQEVEALAKQNLEISNQIDGPDMYVEALLNDSELVMMLLSSGGDYEKFGATLRGHKWQRLSTKRGEGVSPEKKEQVKTQRKELKDILGTIEKLYFYTVAEEVWGNLDKCYPVVATLAKLTKAFMERFTEKKRQRNILDFTDMEHLALDILIEHGGDDIKPSQAACELSERFVEILIDEYQDSNRVQEMLLKSVSREHQGKNNIFMVGDVKQSIYRFRLACPELFMEKHSSYTKEESPCQRIDLHKNFRSRGEVLETVNYLFYQIMQESLGGITYNDEAALYVGAKFKETDSAATSEILLMEKEGQLLKDEEGINAQEIEARMVANRIHEIVGKAQVFDKAIDGYRKARYSDCVILLRTITGWGDTFARVLGDQGVPAHVMSKSGYFSAIEVATVLNYLHICDNPQQEIPFTAILRSPIVGCTVSELATIKSMYPKDRIYEGCKRYCEEYQDSESVASEHDDDTLYEKLRGFYNIFNQVRGKVAYTPIHELIRDILTMTEYGRFVTAMPAGNQRSANINMLIEKAIEFEQTSYRGLFNFIRYIEYLQKYSVDFGEVNVNSENDDTVRIISIHKSKGLEFPIVFVSGMGKKFNLRDSSATIVLHQDYGIGTEYIEPTRRLKAPTLLKQVIKRQTVAESLGEEMRVLYVALTRAKEKLIMTGMVEHLERRIISCANIARMQQKHLSYVTRLKARDYWGWVLPALAKSDSFTELYQRYEIEHPRLLDKTPVAIRLVTQEELVEEAVVRQVQKDINKKLLTNLEQTPIVDKSFQDELSGKFSFVYPYESQIEVPVKTTVSELKADLKRAEVEEGTSYQADIIPMIPNFIEKKEEKLSGAERGTAYHRVMECLNFLELESQEQIASQLEKLYEEKKIDEITKSIVSIEDIWLFANSKLGQRMKAAAINNCLHKEQPFVMSVPASEKDARFSDEDTILVQGIIDIFFFEGDKIVVADYKTDKVIVGQEAMLAEKYGKQLEYYAEALERVTGQKVTEKVIYSFTSACEVIC